MAPFFSSLLGGVLIGTACTIYLMGIGRIAGISGMAAKFLNRQADRPAVIFLLGLMVAPLLWRGISGHWPPLTIREPWFVVVPAGVLVGFGSQMACGCTSGHGVMGLARLSPRSLVAVGCFMTAAIATAISTHHMAGWWTRP